MKTSERIRKLAERAVASFPCDIKNNSEEIQKLEKLAGVTISEEFKQGYLMYAYDLFSSFDFISFPDGVIQETARLKQTTHLPSNALILSEDDASLVIMKCLGDHEEIYWIAVEDFDNYCQSKPLNCTPEIFPTFGDFFEYLLTEEEKRDDE